MRNCPTYCIYGYSFLDHVSHRGGSTNKVKPCYSELFRTVQISFLNVLSIREWAVVFNSG